MKFNEAIYRSPKWLKKLADFEIRTGSDTTNNKEWDKRWADTDRDEFIEFYRNFYPNDKNFDLNTIRRRHRGDFEIWNKFDEWMKGSAERKRIKEEKIRKEWEAERERYRRKREAEQEAYRKEREQKEKQEEIKRDLKKIKDDLISDFKRAPYRDKVSTPTINGNICFNYRFENGDNLLLNGSILEFNTSSHRVTYTLSIIHRTEFISLANALMESELWKQNHRRPNNNNKQSNTNTNKGGGYNDPKSSHPKWKMYQNLKQTVIQREEQLKKMSKSDPNRTPLENEYNAAKSALDRLKNQYQFEHLKSFESYKNDVWNEDGHHIDEVNFIEDLFIEYVDSWDMQHGKYLSNPILQPDDKFKYKYNLWYTVYESFNEKISRLYVPSDYYIELNIEALFFNNSTDSLTFDKEGLINDINRFLNRASKYGWKYVESKTCNPKTFLNKKGGPGESYSNRLTYYLYKD